MIRILLLDCSETLESKLKAQGFDVESGTVGYCTGVRKLPSQVYEKEIFIYDPSVNDRRLFIDTEIKDLSPQYGFEYIKPRIQSGATFVVFLNRISNNLALEQLAYKWIPFMPPISDTFDKTVFANSFTRYPDNNWKLLAPIVTTNDLSLPVLQRITPSDIPPNAISSEIDVFRLFWNGHGHTLGVLILRGAGRLIVLPHFESNEQIAETFLYQVVPKLYDLKTNVTLVDMFTSPAEETRREKLQELETISTTVKARQVEARIQLETAKREKANVITADPTAKQILVYFDQARRQDDAALFYLYKIVESIENKYGGEAAGIQVVGARDEWKSVKRLTNESYRDARHAPKPTDVIKKWTPVEIKKCFKDTETIVMAYFTTLFMPISNQ